MYPLTKPFIDYTNAQLESCSRLVQQNPSGFMQPDALAQLIKSNIENYSRLVQECARSFSTLAVEAQRQMSRGIEETVCGMQQAAKTSSVIVGETVGKMNDTAEEVSGEIEIANVGQPRAVAR